MQDTLQGKHLVRPSTTAVQLDLWGIFFCHVWCKTTGWKINWWITFIDQLFTCILLFLEDVKLTKLFVFGPQTPRWWRPRRTPKAEGTSHRAALHGVRRQPALQHSARRHRCHFQRPQRQERSTSPRQRDRQVQRWAALCNTMRDIVCLLLMLGFRNSLSVKLDAADMNYTSKCMASLSLLLNRKYVTQAMARSWVWS